MENLGSFLAGMGSVFFLLVIWSGVWKAIALWKSARNNHLGWFIALCIINTLGVLEILYIYIWSKKENKNINTPTAPEAPKTTI